MTSLSSDFNFFKEVTSGTATISISGTAAINSVTRFTTTIPHSLGKVPRVKVYLLGSIGDYVPAPMIIGLDGAPGIAAWLYPKVTSSNLVIEVAAVESSGVLRNLTSRTLTFKYFLYTE